MSFPVGSLLSVLAGRVLKNLQFVDAHAPPWVPTSSASDDAPYADTQLLISLLGILVFPHERAPNALGELLDGFDCPLDEIISVKYSAEGRDRVSLSTTPGQPPELVDLKSVGNLPRLLRNSIAHFNIRPINVNGRFGGIRIWNRRQNGQIDFVADLDFEAFRPLALHILDGLHDREGLKLNDPPDPIEELEKHGKL